MTGVLRFEVSMRGSPKLVSRSDLAFVLVELGVEGLEIGVELMYQVKVPDSGEVFGRVRIELVGVGDFHGRVARTLAPRRG